MKRSPTFLLLALVACIPPKSDIAMLAPAGEPVPLENVRIVDGSQTGTCTAIAQLEEPANEREAALLSLRTAAARVGANTLVLGEVRQQTTTGNRILWGGLASSDEVMTAVAYRCPT